MHLCSLDSSLLVFRDGPLLAILDASGLDMTWAVPILAVHKSPSRSKTWVSQLMSNTLQLGAVAAAQAAISWSGHPLRRRAAQQVRLLKHELWLAESANWLAATRTTSLSPGNDYTGMGRNLPAVLLEGTRWQQAKGTATS